MNTKEKPVLYSETAYVLGLAILAAGTALMEAADFGMSMVVAPAYLLHLKLSETLPFFSFGMAEYVLQGVLLLTLGLVMRGFKRAYLFSFVTAVIYGLLLDGALALVPAVSGMAARSLCYMLGLALCSLGIALLFHTYLSPEAYELFVKELANKWNKPIPRVKTGYDCVSCAAAVVMSFAFYGIGRFEGVKMGTIFCALVNGTVIGLFSRVLETHFAFADGLPLRRYFE